MQVLLPEHDFSRREPQQFGMISFTELEPQYAARHASAFGSFGIVVSDAWARANRAERVIYIRDEGPAFDAWRYLFTLGYHDLKSRIEQPDDAAWLMSFENKAAAGAIAGAMLWGTLLQLYEYMEPAEHAHQREWRIVQPLPYYSLSESTEEVVRQVSPPQGWANFLNVVKITRPDIDAFVCPRCDQAALLDALPGEYEDVPVFPLEG